MMTGLKWWDRLQQAEAKVVARVRFAIAVFGVLGVAEAHNLAVGLGWPSSEAWFMRIFTGCGLLSLLLRAGDKTPPSVKALADEHDAQVPVPKLRDQP